MKMKILGIACIAVMFGCAVPKQQIPDRPTGPSAVISDSSKGGGRSGAAFFIVEEINGEAVTSNALRASLSASHNRGADLQVRSNFRYAPAGKVRLKIAGRYAYAAPIQSLFSARASFEVTGVVEVELRPDVQYRVNGNLDAFRREVWVEEESGVLASRKIVSSERTPEAQEAMKASAYTCCNLRYDGDWVSDHNAATLPFIPAGTRIVLRDYGTNRASVFVDGLPMRIGLDYGRKQGSIEQLVSKLIVNEDPGIRIAKYPESIQSAIKQGKVAINMTREQVIIALGYPRVDKTPSLDSTRWTYWTKEDEEFVVIWAADGLVKEVDALGKVKESVMDR